MRTMTLRDLICCGLSVVVCGWIARIIYAARAVRVSGDRWGVQPLHRLAHTGCDLRVRVIAYRIVHVRVVSVGSESVVVS